MRNKASLVLAEVLVMVLVFALTAAICLQCFAAADTLAQETDRQDKAVLLAQNAAETIKALDGDLKKAAELLHPQCPEGLSLTLSRQDSGVPGLGQALVQVSAEQEEIFALTVSWQEAAP